MTKYFQSGWPLIRLGFAPGISRVTATWIDQSLITQFDAACHVTSRVCDLALCFKTLHMFYLNGNRPYHNTTEFILGSFRMQSEWVQTHILPVLIP